MSIWLLWLLLVVIPNVGGISVVLSVGLALAVIVLTPRDNVLYCESMWHEHPKIMLSITVLTIVLGIVGAVSPTKDEMYVLAGGYIVTNAEDIEKLPPNLIKSANKFLETYTEGE